MTLAQEIINHRTKNNLTQEDFAQKVGVSRYTIMDIEKGKRDPWAVTQCKIKIYLEENK